MHYLWNYFNCLILKQLSYNIISNWLMQLIFNMIFNWLMFAWNSQLTCRNNGFYCEWVATLNSWNPTYQLIQYDRKSRHFLPFNIVTWFTMTFTSQSHRMFDKKYQLSWHCYALLSKTDWPKQIFNMTQLFFICLWEGE